jgi:hypothetical protein
MSIFVAPQRIRQVIGEDGRLVPVECRGVVPGAGLVMVDAIAGIHPAAASAVGARP